MDQKDLEYFKQRLLEEERQVREHLSGVAIQADQNDRNNWEGREPEMNIQEADANEVADTIEEFSNNQALTEEIEIRLREILAALERIENGTYGVDKFDGQPIERERLEANPAADTRMANIERTA